MKKLAASNRDKLLDLLTERLTFERTGVRLYDSIIKRIQASQDATVKRLLDDMQEHRDQEKQHEEWLEDQIRQLGGDAHGVTEMAKVVETESQGIEKIIIDGDEQIPHLIHALLTAELADNAGWDLLVRLADDADDREAKRAFSRFLHEEEDHLNLARATMQKLVASEVLGARQEAQP